MESWSQSPWNEFEKRRDQYTREADNARLAKGDRDEQQPDNRHMTARIRLALAFGTIVLIAIGVGGYIAAPILLVAGH